MRDACSPEMVLVEYSRPAESSSELLVYDVGIYPSRQQPLHSQRSHQSKVKHTLMPIINRHIHLPERAQARQNAAANPGTVQPLWRRKDLEASRRQGREQTVLEGALRASCGM